MSEFGLVAYLFLALMKRAPFFVSYFGDFLFES